MSRPTKAARLWWIVPPLLCCLAVFEPRVAAAPSEAPQDDCRLCHRVRYDRFQEGVHGGHEGLDCTTCHTDGQIHADSLGVEPALDPRTLPQPESTALCSSCHGSDHPSPLPESTSCLDCHLFHELSVALESPPRPGAGVSHGLNLGRTAESGDRAAPASETGIEGYVEIGGRSISGGGSAFRSFSQLEAGVRLPRAELHAQGAPDASRVDRVDVDITGLGDPVANGRVELTDSGRWALRFTGYRSEELFDLDSELHDTLSTRRGLSVDWERLSPGGAPLQISYERFEREVDGRLSRYRSISNELFEDTDGDLSEHADLLRVRTRGKVGDWRVSLTPSLRWYRSDDRRALFLGNATLDDMEDFDANSQSWTPSLLLRAESETAGGMLIDVEAFGAYSERDFDSTSTSQGVDAGGDAYEQDLTEDGSARGRYGRAELGLLQEMSDTLSASLRFRVRDEVEHARSILEESTEIPPGGPPTIVRTASDVRVSQRTFDVEATLVGRPRDRFDWTLGYGGRFEDLDIEGGDAPDGDPVTHGAILEGRGDLAPDLRLTCSLRAFAADDPYTAISVDRNELAGAELDWRVLEDVSLLMGGSSSSLRFAADNSHSDLDELHLRLSRNSPDDRLGAQVGVSYQDYEQSVSTTAQVGGFPTPYEARFAGHWVVFDASATWTLPSGPRLWAGLNLAESRGDATSRLLAARVVGEVDLEDDWLLRLGLSSWDYYDRDDPGNEFETVVLEFSVGFGF